MSETLTWPDHFIFAMVPLGILTAVVGAIRVSGPRWMRTIIGRARETRAFAEFELMSSTSHEVCELFNGRYIVRAMGKPQLEQFILFDTPDRNENDCGIHTLQSAVLEGRIQYHGEYTTFKEIKSILIYPNYNLTSKPTRLRLSRTVFTICGYGTTNCSLFPKRNGWSCAKYPVEYLYSLGINVTEASYAFILRAS